LLRTIQHLCCICAEAFHLQCKSGCKDCDQHNQQGSIDAFGIFFEQEQMHQSVSL